MTNQVEARVEPKGQTTDPAKTLLAELYNRHTNAEPIIRAALLAAEQTSRNQTLRNLAQWIKAYDQPGWKPLDIARDILSMATDSSPAPKSDANDIAIRDRALEDAALVLVDAKDGHGFALAPWITELMQKLVRDLKSKPAPKSTERLHWERTMQLREFRPHALAERGQYQQLWQCKETSLTEWRAIAIEHGL